MHIHSQHQHQLHPLAHLLHLSRQLQRFPYSPLMIMIILHNQKKQGKEILILSKSQCWPVHHNCLKHQHQLHPLVQLLHLSRQLQRFPNSPLMIMIILHNQKKQGKEILILSKNQCWPVHHNCLKKKKIKRDSLL